MTVVTLSASYGSGGSQVGPRLADRLGVAFIDRVIPTPSPSAWPSRSTTRWPTTTPCAAPSSACSCASPRPRRPSRAPATPPELLHSARPCGRPRTSSVSARRGVGRHPGTRAAVRPARQAGALPVRLDGPPERRLAQATGPGSTARGPSATARDRTAREAYVQQFYGFDARDAALTTRPSLHPALVLGCLRRAQRPGCGARSDRVGRWRGRARRVCASRRPAGCGGRGVRRRAPPSPPRPRRHHPGRAAPPAPPARRRCAGACAPAPRPHC